MFRILCDTSSGSTELCLTEITRGDSQILCRVPRITLPNTDQAHDKIYVNHHE
jgi:hypothetical protein